MVHGVLAPANLAGAGAPRDGAAVGAAPDVVLLDVARGGVPDGEAPVVGAQGQANAGVDVVETRTAAEAAAETEVPVPVTVAVVVAAAAAIPATRPHGATRPTPRRAVRGAAETVPTAPRAALALPSLAVATATEVGGRQAHPASPGAEAPREATQVAHAAGATVAAKGAELEVTD